jgi:hypothetical protein
MKRFILILTILLLVIGGFFAYQKREVIRDWIELRTKPALPQAESYRQIVASEKTTSTVGYGESPAIQPTVKTVSEQMHLLVPFTPQAPNANWAMPYQEACEEASLLMVAGYYHGDQGTYATGTADTKILDLIGFEQDQFGLGPDMTAAQTAEVIQAYDPSLQAEVVAVTSIDQIKLFVAQGIPVIVPADGKALANPNFRNGGPVYHMLVITGYDAEGHFITNDPGTRKGYDYMYDEQVLLNAIHDWNGGDVPNGNKVMIVIYPKK